MDVGLRTPVLCSPGSSYSPRGPLDERLLKNSLYSDSETDFFGQDQHLEHATSLDALERVLELDVEASIGGEDETARRFEPAPFQWDHGCFFFPLPRIQLGAGANGVVEKVFWKNPDTGKMEQYAVKIMTPPTPVAHLGPLQWRQIGHFEKDVLSEITLLEEVYGLPHVVRLAQHFKTADGTFYVVMEYIEGRSMDELISMESAGLLQLSWSVKRKMLRQLAEALASCHKGGVFHGDVKPHNVKARQWIDDDGNENVHATLLDFGAGCFFKGSMGMLPPGQGLFGTAAYMAPEQIKACLQRRQGLPRGPLQGPAIDCWALGLTAFEILTGQPLFGVKNEAPRELWDEVEAAREYHEHQLAAEYADLVNSLDLS
eukprot:jgi/Botrbrau1/4255/Bobra.0044s0050.2